MRTVVIVPTYQEAENIGVALDRVVAALPETHVLVVDDGSPDGTADLVAERAVGDPRIHLLRRQSKDGLGAAYRAGFVWALDRDYDAIVEMDADLSHPPESLPLLLRGLAFAGVSIGSRYTDGGSTVGWPWHREVVSRIGNLYASFALRLGVSDATSGFRAYRREVLEDLHLEKVRSNGYCFQIEMTDRARQAGFGVAEVPITFTERVAGSSKMSGSIVAEAVSLVTRWGIAHWLIGERLHPQRRRVDLEMTITAEPSRAVAS